MTLVSRWESAVVSGLSKVVRRNRFRMDHMWQAGQRPGNPRARLPDTVARKILLTKLSIAICKIPWLNPSRVSRNETLVNK